MRKRKYGPKVFKESYDQYIEEIMKREKMMAERHIELEKELFESGKQIEVNNKSADDALDELDALFN